MGGFLVSALGCFAIIKETLVELSPLLPVP